MANCRDNILPLAQALLTCATDALVACGAPVSRASLVPGAQAAWDTCCDDGEGEGQLWVLVRSITPQQIQGGGYATCAIEFEAQLEVGILRCSVAMLEDGEPPTAETLDDEAVRMFLDAAIIREAILCCWGANLDPGSWAIGVWSPNGPQGGCAGGTTAVTVRFSDCAC